LEVVPVFEVSTNFVDSTWSVYFKERKLDSYEPFANVDVVVACVVVVVVVDLDVVACVVVVVVVDLDVVSCVVVVVAVDLDFVACVVVVVVAFLVVRSILATLYSLRL
jgi:hypothetical protein